MKKFWSILCAIIFSCLCFVGCSSEEGGYETPDMPDVFAVSYIAVIDGEEASIPVGMYKEDGNYPVRYLETQGAKVDPLQEFVVGRTTYTFEGWYLEKACQTQITEISTSQTGKLTLYAKIRKTVEELKTQSITYYAIINGEKTGIPQSMYDTDKTKYPATYIVFVGATIGDLLTDDEYIFEGWFSDESCQTPFTGITATDENPVIVYAKVTHNPVVQRNVSYTAIINGEESTIPAGMYISGGNYPSNYTQTQGVDIDPLQDLVEGGTAYFFKGWYLEKDCQTQVTGIPATQTGKTTVYAKIVKETARVFDINYFAIINGEKTGIPQSMYDTDTSKYPSSYTVGFGASIGELVSSEEYIFEGWFKDESCQTPFTGISKTDENAVTVYAKVTHIVIIRKSISYQAVIDGVFASFPYGFFEASKFPTEFVVGEGVTVPNITKQHPDFEFEGWYTDAACTQPFSGRIALETDDVVLYAKIAKSTHSGNYT